MDHNPGKCASNRYINRMVAMAGWLLFAGNVSKCPGRLCAPALLTFSALILPACNQEKVAISISGLNYTDRYIQDFSVNGYSGANIDPNGGGGSFICCASIPARWREGLMVTVRWKDDDNHPDRYKEQLVPIPSYTDNDIGTLVVHFYPNDVVKILVTTKTNRYPGYPFPRPQKRLSI